MGSADYVLERWYGVANKAIAQRFPLFNRDVHVIKKAQIPARGMNNLFMDPCGGRNPFFIWVRETPGASWVYREWPGNYEIPGQDVPGPWTLPDGKKKDGRPGPAQQSFGFGLAQIKFEMARLEQWKAITQQPRQEDEGEKAWYIRLSESLGSVENVRTRFIDSRYASAKKENADMPTTLILEFLEIGLVFEPAKAEFRVLYDPSVNAGGEGVTIITDRLAYDPGKPVDFFNKPRLFICEDCANLIYSLENWTGLDGGKGAAKDPIDCLRMWAVSGCEWEDPEDLEVVGGGCF
jgi:hypothetical protein